MNITIKVPEVFVEVLSEDGYTEQQVADMFKQYMDEVFESPSCFIEEDFFGWVEDREQSSN